MKRITKFLIITTLLLGAIFINSEVQALMPLSGKVFIIDPGHGGKDPGTISGSTYESNINRNLNTFETQKSHKPL